MRNSTWSWSYVYLGKAAVYSTHSFPCDVGKPHHYRSKDFEEWNTQKNCLLLRNIHHREVSWKKLYSFCIYRMTQCCIWFKKNIFCWKNYWSFYIWINHEQFLIELLSFNTFYYLRCFFDGSKSLMSIFTKIVKLLSCIKYFPRNFHHRCLTRFWLRASESLLMTALHYSYTDDLAIYCDYSAIYFNLLTL